MHNILEQPARARLITADCQELSIPATLRYTAADPLAAHIDFPAAGSLDGEPVTWTFARSLLEEGLGTAAGIGDVHIWRCGPVHTVVELHSQQGAAVIRFETAALHHFLLRSYDVVEPGREDLGPALDRGLTSLLGGV